MEKIQKTFSASLTVIKDKCKEMLFETLTKNENKIFELIDPLLSDNQCQVHSILILNTLLKCYQYEECTYNIKCLQEDDIELLCDAILLTLLKINQTDKFDMVVRQESLEHFGGLLDSKKKESRFIAEIKENFNSKSIRFIRNIAKKSVKRILEECTANIPHSGIKLQLLPCYATLYALITYIKDTHLPIVISLKRLELNRFPSDVKYRINSTDLFYYKWNGEKFQCFEKLSECEMTQPCITFESYSLYDVGFGSSSLYVSNYQKYIANKRFPSKSFFMNCDIGHLIMASLSTHFQLSQSKELTINSSYHNGDDYIDTIYKNSSTESTSQSYSVESKFEANGTNIYEEYLGHLSLGKEFNCDDSQYSRFCNRIAIRRVKNAFFGVHVSNHSSEISKLLSINIDLEVDRFEIFSDINREAALLNIFEKLGMSAEVNSSYVNLI